MVHSNKVTSQAAASFVNVSGTVEVPQIQNFSNQNPYSLRSWNTYLSVWLYVLHRFKEIWDLTLLGFFENLCTQLRFNVCKYGLQKCFLRSTAGHTATLPQPTPGTAQHLSATQPPFQGD